MSRVNEVAAALEKIGIRVNTLNAFSEAAEREWRSLLGEYAKEPGARIPLEAVIKSQKYLENKKWLQDALERGDSILDLGDPFKREISAFYEMERTEIMNFLTRVLK